MMRLAIDATPILPGRKGLGLFLENLLDHLVNHPMSNSFVVYIDETFWEVAQEKWPSLCLERVNARPSFLWEQIQLERKLREENVEVLLTGRDRTCCEPRIRTVVYLFEVPDYRTYTTLKSNGGLYPKLSAKYSRWRFASISRKIGRFIVSSQATLNDLVRMYEVPRERIEIVYPGIQRRFFKPATAEIRAAAKNYFCAGKSYVLHFATGDPRDNTEAALEAFARSLTGIDLDVALLLAGVRDKEVKHVEEEVKKKGIANRTYYTGFLEDDLLVRAYQGAEVYLDPTFYEGFGFQLGEAMACGVPVLSSKVTSVPEIVGEAGLLFEPSDVDGFARGLQRLMAEPNLRTELSRRGKEQASHFLWTDTAEKIIAEIEQTYRHGK